MLAAFAAFGRFPGMTAAWVPLLMLLTLSMGLAIGLLLGVVNVFVRDVGQIVPVALQFGFWLAPIAYTPDIVPGGLRRLVQVNPMTPIVEGYQSALLFDRAPDVSALAWLALTCVLLLVAALTMFRRASPEMVDVL